MGRTQKGVLRMRPTEMYDFLIDRINEKKAKRQKCDRCGNSFDSHITAEFMECNGFKATNSEYAKAEIKRLQRIAESLRKDNSRIEFNQSEVSEELIEMLNNLMTEIAARVRPEG